MEPLNDKVSDDIFLPAFENLIDQMVDYERFSRERFIKDLCSIARMFRLSKVVTEFYKNSTDEKEGKGEILCDFDEGHPDKVVLRKQVRAKSGAIIKATAYASSDTADLSAADLKRVDLVIRSMLSFVSRNRMQYAIERLAYHDESEYPNLPFFFRYLEKEKAARGFADKIAIMFNLRNFTVINRDLGQMAGDRIMRAYYEAVKEIMGSEGQLCRVGGDNFIGLFPSSQLEKVKAAMHGIAVVYDRENDRRVLISACAGLYIIPSDFVLARPGMMMEILYPVCQAARTEAHGTIIFANKKKALEKENEMLVRHRFEHGLESGEFIPFYQPKVDVRTGRIVGAEALCRWIRNGEIVPPAEFIPVLEKSMDICRLDFSILGSVCRDIRRWLDEGREVVRISVNLSRKQLIDVDLLEHLVRVIEKNRVPYKYIEFELTETTTEVDFKKLRRLVEGLQQIGISTAVDDFGMGYSSLNLIRELPWNVLKIDRSLLPGVGTDNKTLSTKVFKHIAAMANDIGLECLAEGVETPEQTEILKENGCPYAQGFYYDRPLPAEDFEKAMERGSY